MKNYFCLMGLLTSLSIVGSLQGGLMEGFPPPPNEQVTAENWTEPPFNQWGYQNVRRVSFTAAINRGSHPATSFERQEKDLLSIPLHLPNDSNMTVAQVLEATNTDGFLVLHHGKIITEKYFNTMKPDTLHIIWSCSKSILGTLSAILIEKNILDPKTLVTHYIPELKQSGYADATIQNLLDMNVSLESNLNEKYTAYQNEKNWSAYRFVQGIQKGDGGHGELFSYTNPTATVLGWVIERATNRHLTSLISEMIWSPLGAELEANSMLDSIGTSLPSGGFSTTLSDLGRFGQMILQKGNFNGKQIVPKAWVDDIRKNGNKQAFANSNYVAFMPNGYYRDMWWADGNDNLFAFGANGQLIYVNFAADIVVVKLSSQPTVSDVGLQGLTFLGIGAIVENLTKPVTH